MSEAIREARTGLGVTLPTVAREVDVDAEALLRFESGELEVPGEVLWRLSDTLGIPFEELQSDDQLRAEIDALSVRFKNDRRGVSETIRLAVARAAGAARHFVELEELAGLPSRYESLRKQFPGDPRLPPRRTWTAGRDLALEARNVLGAGGPIRSVLNVISEKLGILVIWQRLPVAVAGYAFCDEVHGPTIVINVKGRNSNELVRRFTLAHEAAHVLYDRGHFQEMASFDTYEDLFEYTDDRRDPREIRANAFAIHLLAPEPDIRKAWRPELGVSNAVRVFMVQCGISYEAARYHLANYGLLAIEERVAGVATTAPDELKVSEGSELWYPAFDSVPIERRHAVAPLAFKLWRAGIITTGRLRELLGSNLSHEEISDLAELYLPADAA